MAALLATGTSAASSADFTLTGEATTLFLVSTAEVLQNSKVVVEIKGANGLYYPFGNLDQSAPVVVLSSPGVYRVSRPAGVDVGVDRY